MHDSTAQLKAALQELTMNENVHTVPYGAAVPKKNIGSMELSGEASAFLKKRAEYLESVRDVSAGDF